VTRYVSHSPPTPTPTPTPTHPHVVPQPACTPRSQDLLRLIDLCPFLASERSRYDDDAVRAILLRNPRVARLRRTTYRCGIGNGPNGGAHPLALVVGLGGSIDVVVRMVEACPIALVRRLSGRRNVLHYAIAEGANVDVIRYLASRMPSLVTEVDSFGALPLHLASTYFPSSSPLVLLHLLGLHPEAARAVDNKSRTPLHRACASRASMEKVLALIEAYPPALFMNDWMRTTPLGYAESMHQRLSEPMPAVIEVLGMAMDILGTNEDDDDVAPPSSSALYDGNDHVAGIVVDGGRGGGEGGDGDRARRILEHFRTIRWRGGIRLAFARNVRLVSMLDLPVAVLPRLLSLLDTEGVYSLLVHRPDVVRGCSIKR
jgi:hypothetical protein